MFEVREFFKTNIRRLNFFGALVLVAGSFACRNFSQPPKPDARPQTAQTISTPARETKKMSQDYIDRIRKNDRSVLEKASEAPEDLPKEIDRAISGFDEEARELAVEFVARQDGRYAGTFLLRRVGDASPDVAMLAIEKLDVIISKPGVDEIISRIARVKDPFIRGKLYLDIGKRKEENLLGKLRPVVESEEDEEAALRGLAALVKLGGSAERGEFLDRVRATEPDDALEMQDLLIYIGSADVAGGLIPWLQNTEDVMRIGGDRQNMMARMCDVGVWTAHLLGVALPFETTHLRNFTDEELKQTEEKLKNLPQ